TELRAGPAQVRLQNLAHVHTAGNAQRVQQDLHGRAVLEERHILARQDLRHDALIAVAAGHLVAHRNHALRGDVDLDHLQYAAAQLVTTFHAVELAVALVDRRLHGRPLFLVELPNVGDPLLAP